ncbi:hypothetical protein HP439_14650 [Sphingobacterium shayense]|uniref:hypothetical protein n=1 Tax=Sphingobacterium shayense TaxID=626343 RepID=UPI001554BB0A|nr:hypothetical protein [Sphingobacterium shayense]NQD71963.1 hypothetical protein [Sphingobacterium shayense]
MKEDFGLILQRRLGTICRYPISGDVSLSSYHFFARCATSPAGFSAYATMFHPHTGVFFALGSTAFAYFCAHFANVGCDLPVDSHYFESSVTNYSTFHIQLDTRL